MHIKSKILHRLVAKSIDLLIGFLFGAFLPRVVGPLCGFLYTLLADGIHWRNFSGQSIGKKIMGLRVVHTIEKRPGNYVDSVIRNAPLGFATFFGIIPLWGWLILFLIGIPIIALEVYLMVAMESGYRIGDVMADTEVIEVEAPLF